MKSLNANPDWMKILGLKRADKNQKDVELVLRLLSLFEQWSDYEKPMLKYLNTWMSKNRDFTSETCEKFSRNFVLATKKVNEALQRPFRPKNVINAAVLEAVMLVVLEYPDLDATQFAERYQLLMVNDEFLSLIRGATTDTARLVTRARVAKRVLLNEPR